MGTSAGSAFGIGADNTEYSENTTLTDAKNGTCGNIYGTATVTINLELFGMYLLFCSSYTKSSGAVYGATTRLITCAGVATGTPTNLSLGQTSSAPATISMAANNKITIANGAATRCTQFQLMRVL